MNEDKNKKAEINAAILGTAILADKQLRGQERTFNRMAQYLSTSSKEEHQKAKEAAKGYWSTDPIVTVLTLGFNLRANKKKADAEDAAAIARLSEGVSPEVVALTEQMMKKCGIKMPFPA